jgi:hypothetical protein
VVSIGGFDAVKISEEDHHAMLTAICWIDWPAQRRDYMTGTGETGGLTGPNASPPVVDFGAEGAAEMALLCNDRCKKYFQALGYDVDYTTIQPNLLTVADWHVDPPNEDLSALTVLGDGQGGEVETMERGPAQLCGYVVKLDGQIPHRSLEFEGLRARLVFFRHRAIMRASQAVAEQLSVLGFPTRAPQTRVGHG